jgi:branched-chain amino acid transport system substrate-binding protein
MTDPALIDELKTLVEPGKVLTDADSLNAYGKDWTKHIAPAPSAYSPPKTIEQVRRLVEGDGVFLIFNALGTPSNTATQKYLNSRKVPQLFVATGATRWGDYKQFPWTMGWQPPYQREAMFYARHVLDTKPDARIGVLYQNDDFGKDNLIGLKDGLSEKVSMIVAEAPYDLSDATVDSQMVRLKASNADVFFNLSTPKFAAQATRKLGELNWKPVHILNNVAASVGAVLKPAGFENAQDAITANYIKDPTDPAWKDDPAIKAWAEFMDKYVPDGDKSNALTVYAYAAGQTLHKVLEQAGDDLSRENIMKQATHLKDIELGLLIDGIRINTSPTNYFPITQMQLMRFNGKGFDPVGPVQKHDVKLYV